MDEQQLQRLYREETSTHVNPPSYRIWLECRRRRQEYEARQTRIRNNPPDEDYWNQWRGSDEP